MSKGQRERTLIFKILKINEAMHGGQNSIFGSYNNFKHASNVFKLREIYLSRYQLPDLRICFIIFSLHKNILNIVNQNKLSVNYNYTYKEDRNHQCEQQLLSKAQERKFLDVNLIKFIWFIDALSLMDFFFT